MNKLRVVSINIGMQKNARFYNIPSFLIKVEGCNLRCMRDGALCIHAAESKPTITIRNVKKFINENKHINHIMIYGGEPLLYKAELEKLLNDIWREDMHITIQTNGTLPMLNPLAAKVKVDLYIIKLSDKILAKAGDKLTIGGKEIILGTSDIEAMGLPINTNILRNICIYSKDYLLCFKASPERLKYLTNEIVTSICEDTDEEFFKNFLKNHSPHDHIVYIPRNKNEANDVKKICFETGKFYNENY